MAQHRLDVSLTPHWRRSRPAPSLLYGSFLALLPEDSPEERCREVAREAVRLRAVWREYQTSAEPPDVDALQEALVRLVYLLGAARRDLEGELLLENAIAQLHICDGAVRFVAGQPAVGRPLISSWRCRVTSAAVISKGSGETSPAA